MNNKDENKSESLVLNSGLYTLEITRRNDGSYQSITIFAKAANNHVTPVITIPVTLVQDHPEFGIELDFKLPSTL